MKKLLILLFLLASIGFAQEKTKAVPANKELRNKKVTQVTAEAKDAKKAIVAKEVGKKDLEQTDKNEKATGEAIKETTEGTKEEKKEAKLEEKIEKFESKVFSIASNPEVKDTLGTYYIQGNLPLPKNITVKDVPNDGGGVLEIAWKYHTKDKAESFEVLRKSDKDKVFKKIEKMDTTIVKYAYIDKTNREWETYNYQIQIDGKPIQINGILVPAEFKVNKRKEMVVQWKYPFDKLPKEFTILRKKIKTEKKDAFKAIATLDSQKENTYSFRDDGLDDSMTYSYKIRIQKDGLYADSKPVKGQSQTAFFDTKKLVMLIAGIFLVFAIVFFIRMARAGKELYIRRIAGLDAVDDAVGRATEMGREIMFVPGITDIDDPQTIAGLTILGRVAKLTAQYKTPLSVPVSRSMVMITGREIVKESYLSAGRPENFQDNMIYYLTDDQFGFAAGVDGIMVREKPATIFLQGSFFAESLILAETGHHIGAIQISGTAAPSQLPFFITACDYTLMGEELYAASAYLSREPQLLGSLRGQDAGKALILVAIIIGIILETASFVFDAPHLSIKEYFNLK